MWLRYKLEHYLRKSTESHHMRTLCQIIMGLCLVNFLGTVSTDYFSQLLLSALHSRSPITPQLLLLPDHFLIVINIDIY